MELVLIGAAALLASTLTLFSGFGLGTMMTPVFALFFPLPLAIAATAVVHLASNLFKVGLLARNADARVLAHCARLLGHEGGEALRMRELAAAAGERDAQRALGLQLARMDEAAEPGDAAADTQP